MKSELVSQEKNKVEIKIEFEGQEFTAELKKVFDNISRRAGVPGFRKGYVPRRTIEMRFGKASIYDETVENLLNASIEGIINDYDLEPLMAPQVKARGNIVEGEPVTANLVFEVRPEINLPPLEDIEVERLITKLDDKDVDEMIETIRKAHATHETVSEPAGEQSIVSVEFTILNKPQKPEMATISMEEPPLPEFRDALLGKNVGDEVEVSIPSPQQGGEPLTGETLTYSLKITEVGKRILPELNPEFFKNVTGKDCADETQFRDELASSMLKRLGDKAQSDAESRAIALLSQKTEFEVPGVLVYREMEAIKKSDERSGMFKGMEPAEYDKQVMLRAWSTVRSSLIVEELGKVFETKIDPAELDDWIDERSKRDGIDPSLMHKAYYNNRESVNMLSDRVFAEKTVKTLMEKVRIKDVSELTPIELPKIVEEEKEGE